jgi:hypothetical protein
MSGSDDQAWRLIHTTYAHALESLERNEEMGERRLQVLFTVASAAAVAVGLVAERGADAEATLWAAAGAASIVSLIGLLTVLRLARRNTSTSKLIESLTAIRRQVIPEDSKLRLMFPYDPYEPLRPREQSRMPTKGGLVDIAGCTTAAFSGVAVLFATLAIDTHIGGAALSVLGVAFGVVVAIGAWLGQVALVRRLYAGKK